MLGRQGATNVEHVYTVDALKAKRNTRNFMRNLRKMMGSLPIAGTDWAIVTNVAATVHASKTEVIRALRTLLSCARSFTVGWYSYHGIRLGIWLRLENNVGAPRRVTSVLIAANEWDKELSNKVHALRAIERAADNNGGL